MSYKEVKVKLPCAKADPDYNVSKFGAMWKVRILCNCTITKELFSLLIWSILTHFS